MGPQPSDWGSAAADLPGSLTADGQAPSGLFDTLARAASAVDAGGKAMPALVDDDAMTTSVLAGPDASVRLKPGAEARPTFYSLTSGETALPSASWVLEARSGEGAWTELDRRQNERFHWPRQLRPFRIAQPGSWREYRLRPLESGSMALAEVELLQPTP